jgi:oligoribonuclease (3'-5' exoribonuclease)
MRWEQRGCYSTSGRLFEVIVEVRELVTDGASIAASSKDVLPEHRREIIAVMRDLAQKIHEEGQQ